MEERFSAKNRIGLFRDEFVKENDGATNQLLSGD